MLSTFPPMIDYYEMIFKRKSFHFFRGDEKISAEELKDIRDFKSQGLYEEIKVAIKVVKSQETTCKRGEYCVLFYSEEKENYRQNIGYIGEKLDLWLASKNIGACWYGMGKVQDKYYDGLSFVIMMAIKKVSETDFRKDMFKSKRKPLSEIWEGDYQDIGQIVRFAPSACNTQPWMVKAHMDELLVYRQEPRRRGMMPKSKISFYNSIDMGIFLLFLEIVLRQKNRLFQRDMFVDWGKDEQTLLAKYQLL